MSEPMSPARAVVATTAIADGITAAASYDYARASECMDVGVALASPGTPDDALRETLRGYLSHSVTRAALHTVDHAARAIAASVYVPHLRGKRGRGVSKAALRRARRRRARSVELHQAAAQAWLDVELRALEVAGELGLDVGREGSAWAAVGAALAGIAEGLKR